MKQTEMKVWAFLVEETSQTTAKSQKISGMRIRIQM